MQSTVGRKDGKLSNHYYETVCLESSISHSSMGLREASTTEAEVFLLHSLEMYLFYKAASLKVNKWHCIYLG